MAKFDLGRLLAGLISGGITEIAHAATSLANGAARSSSGSDSSSEEIFDPQEMLDEAMKQQTAKNDENARNGYMNHYNENYMEHYSEGSGLGNWFAKQTGSRLTDAEMQANMFNRNERLAAQEFNHNEAGSG